MKEQLQELQLESEAIDTQVAEARQQVAILESREQDAVARRNRAALDKAWADHDVQLQRIRALEERREQIDLELVRQVESEIEHWRTNCILRVQRWREEQSTAVQRMLAQVSEVAATVEYLDSLSQAHEHERTQQLLEFDAIHSLLGSEFVRPEIDWTVPAPDFNEIASRLSQLSARCLSRTSAPALDTN